MNNRVYEDKDIAADYDGIYILITYKAQGKSVQVASDSKPAPVTGSIASACRARGIDPATRRMYGKLAGAPVMPAEVAEAIYAAVAALPEVQEQRLREERAGLVDRIHAILDETGEARERAQESGFVNGLPSYDSAEYRETKAALAAFDAAHPEIVAALKAEDKADAERHMWD